MGKEVGLQGFNFIDGSPVVITLDSAGITAELKGEPESSLSCTDPPPSDASSWYISLTSEQQADWMFYEQC